MNHPIRLFAMKLALRMGKSISELVNSMSVSEFRQWMAFNHLSPIGDERADVLHAITAFSAVRPHVKRGTNLNVSNFIPNWSKEQKRAQVEAKLSQHFIGLAKRQS